MWRRIAGETHGPDEHVEPFGVRPFTDDLSAPRNRPSRERGAQYVRQRQRCVRQPRRWFPTDAQRRQSLAAQESLPTRGAFVRRPYSIRRQRHFPRQLGEAIPRHSRQAEAVNAQLSLKQAALVGFFVSCASADFERAEVVGVGIGGVVVAGAGLGGSRNR